MSRRAIATSICLAIFVASGSAFFWLHHSRFGSGPIDVATLGNFTLDQINGVDADIPQPIRELDGTHVTLLGEMWQPLSNGDGNENVSGFDLTRLAAYHDYQVPQVQQFIRCTVPPNRKALYYPNTVEVTGILHVGIEKDAVRVSSVFRLDVEQVQPKP
jgi:hypothetical protein